MGLPRMDTTRNCSAHNSQRRGIFDLQGFAREFRNIVKGQLIERLAARQSDVNSTDGLGAFFDICGTRSKYRQAIAHHPGHLDKAMRRESQHFIDAVS